MGCSVWADAAGWRRRRAVDYMVSIQYLKQMERMTVRSTPSIVFGSVAVWLRKSQTDGNKTLLLCYRGHNSAAAKPVPDVRLLAAA